MGDTKDALPQGGLQYLIQDHRGDRSYAKLAADCGLLAPTAGRQLHRLAHAPIRSFPEANTVRGLARGLKVSPWTVLRAAAVSLGIPMSSDDDEDLVIPGAGRLPLESRTLMVSMAEHLMDAHSRPWGEDQDGYGLAANEGHAGIDPEETEPNP